MRRNTMLHHIAPVMNGRTIEALRAAGEKSHDAVKQTAKNAGKYPTDFAFRLFALERLIARFREGPLADALILKGGTLMLALPSAMVRTTDDVDFSSLVRIDMALIQSALLDAFAAAPAQEDGLTYHLDTEACKLLGPDEDHRTFRLYIDVLLHTRHASTEIRMKIDISRLDGHAVGLQEVTLPRTSKRFDPPTVQAYCWEQVVAEKLHACHKHGALNTRYRDYYDLLNLARSGVVDAEAAAVAVVDVFAATGHAAELETDALTVEWAEMNQDAWAKMLNDKNLKNAPTDFVDVLAEIRGFVGPILDRAAELQARPGHGRRAA